MVLKFKDGITPEDVILKILQAEDTTIILLSETSQIDKPKEIGIVVFVLQITFAEKFKDAFDRSGLPLSSDNVIILKFFVYNHNPISTQIVDNEVNTQTTLALQTSSQQICPSVLYCKDIKEDTIDDAIYALLKRNRAEKKSDILNRAEPNKILGGTMYHYISLTNISSLKFDDCKKKAFFMEFVSCKTLLEFCEISENFNMGNSVTSIDGIPLTIGHTPNTPNLVLGLDNRSFKTMALHYVTLKLFKLNCIHGDLHASNVYVLLDGTNIVFLVIDLGNGKIDVHLQLKLHEITDKTTQIEVDDTLVFNLRRIFCIKGKPPLDHAKRLAQLYLELEPLKPDTVINPIIDKKIYNKSYFDAAVMINMCVEIDGHYDSTFLTYVTMRRDIFIPLYCCYKDLITEQMCDQIIEQCLYPIIDTQPEPKRAKTTGGSFIYKNRINKFIASKQINNKSKKSKKRKNKTINRKNSRKITRKKLKNRRQK
jgi:hypothetical protein